MEISIIHMLFQFDFVGDDSKFIWVNNIANKNIYSLNEVIMLFPNTTGTVGALATSQNLKVRPIIEETKHVRHRT